jgi:hypothetical protein
VGSSPARRTTTVDSPGWDRRVAAEAGGEGVDVVHRWTDVDRGGQFAALEDPETLAGDVRECFRPLR